MRLRNLLRRVFFFSNVTVQTPLHTVLDRLLVSLFMPVFQGIEVTPLRCLLASVAAYAACLRLYGGVTCNSVALKYRIAVHASIQQRGISRLRLNSNPEQSRIVTRWLGPFDGMHFP